MDSGRPHALSPSHDSAYRLVTDEPPPYDFLTVLQKSQFNPQLIRTFAERKRAQNLLVAELNRLLEPSNDFIRLALQNIETRKLTESVLESWKPVLANAIGEWAKQMTLSTVLNSPAGIGSPFSDGQSPAKVETTQEELDGFTTVQRLLGPGRPIAYEDTVAYFKIHLPERSTWVIARLYFGKRRLCVWVPLEPDRIEPLVQPLVVSSPEKGWASITLGTTSDLNQLGEVFCAAWDQQRALRTKGGIAPEEGPTPEPAEAAPPGLTVFGT